MSRTSFANVDCGVAQAVNQVGDKWALVIVRSAFLGLRRFDEFSAHLNIAPNVLSNRLSQLVENDILYKKTVPEDGRVIEYQLTAKGHDLYPLILFLNQWAERWMPPKDGPRLEMSDRRTGNPIRTLQLLSSDGDQLGSRDVAVRSGPSGSKVMDHAREIVANRKLKANK